MTDDQEVYVKTNHAGGGVDCYHTDPDCMYLQRANSKTRKSRSLLADDVEECEGCRGDDPNTKGERDYSYNRSLRDAAANPDSEWSPTQADLRKGETEEDDSHAQRNLEQLRMADREVGSSSGGGA